MQEQYYVQAQRLQDCNIIQLIVNSLSSLETESCGALLMQCCIARNILTIWVVSIIDAVLHSQEPSLQYGLSALLMQCCIARNHPYNMGCRHKLCGTIHHTDHSKPFHIHHQATYSSNAECIPLF